MIVLISIGNSDDKLSQKEWAEFWNEMNNVLTTYTDVNAVYGVWTSVTTSRYQNACWQVEIRSLTSISKMRKILKGIAKEYRQDSIAWTECKETEFLG